MLEDGGGSHRPRDEGMEVTSRRWRREGSGFCPETCRRNIAPLTFVFRLLTSMWRKKTNMVLQGIRFVVITYYNTKYMYKKLLSLLLKTSIYLVCMCLRVCVCLCAQHSVLGEVGKWLVSFFFFFFTMWILGIKHRSSAMMASTFALCDISMALALLNGPCISL